MEKKTKYSTTKQEKEEFVDALSSCLQQHGEIYAAYLFGSAASGEAMVNDLDILVLLHQEIDKDEAYINLIYNLSKSLKISESCVDLLFFDSNEADPYNPYPGCKPGNFVNQS